MDHSEGAYSFWEMADAAEKSDPLIRVDALLLTRYHYRQISRLTRFLEERELKFLILPKPSKQDLATARILAERAMRAHCQVLWYSSADCCIGYHDVELRFSYERWDPTVPRRVTVYQDDRITTYSLVTPAADSAE